MRCDENTFAAMYADVYIDLYRFALCMMKHTQEAEDAVSEAVLAAWENVRKLRREDAFRSWIFTILANVCKKKLRESALRQKNTCEEAEADALALPIQPDYGLALDVRKAFYILSEEEQMIVGLSVFGGYNSREIGKMLKLLDSTVRSKRKRALAKMSCILE